MKGEREAYNVCMYVWKWMAKKSVWLNASFNLTYMSKKIRDEERGSLLSLHKYIPLTKNETQYVHYTCT